MKLLKSLCSEKREITAPVLVPEETDFHGHIYSEEEVYKACRNYQEVCDRGNLQHIFDLSNDSAEFVEHYLAPVDMAFEDSDTIVKKGTWLATMKIKNDALWQDVKDGKFTGFSISAKCLSREIQKSKVAGSKAKEEGIETVKRLFDITFDAPEHHVALVDEAANATEVLVLKQKTKKKEDSNMPTPEEKAAEEALMKQKAKEELEREELQKAKDEQLEQLLKEKEEREAKLEQIEKAKADQDAKLEELLKEKEVKELEVLVQKATELKADDADAFGLILKKCKYSLEEAEYTELVKQLDKLTNVVKANEDGEFENRGEANAENVEKSKSDRILELRAEYIEKGLTAPEASKKARLEIDAEESK